MLSVITSLMVFLPIFFTDAKPVFAQLIEGNNIKLHLQEIYETEPTPTLSPSSLVRLVSPSPTPALIQSYGQSELSISDDFVDFGPLSPTDPVMRQLTFTVTGQNMPFLLYQQMDHDLQSDHGESIPKTSCDNGSCSDHQASLWNSTLTYGLGIRCDNLRGTVCPYDFIEKNTFRPLGQRLEQTDYVLSSGFISDQAVINMTYKLIIPGTQQPGNYSARASYILIPGI